MTTSSRIDFNESISAISAIKEHLTIINENIANHALKSKTTTGRIANTFNNVENSNSKGKFTDKTKANMPLRISMRHFESALQKIKKRSYHKHGV
jgi:hypothetical protein